MLDGQLDITEYRSIKNKYESLIKESEDEMKAASPKASDYKQYLNFGFNILQNVDRIYVSGNPHLKNKILCSMYAEKWIFDGEEYRTPTYHPELALIMNAVNSFGPNKKGQSQNGLTLSSMVDLTEIMSNQIYEIFKALYSLKELGFEKKNVRYRCK